MECFFVPFTHFLSDLLNYKSDRQWINIEWPISKNLQNWEWAFLATRDKMVMKCPPKVLLDLWPQGGPVNYNLALAKSICQWLNSSNNKGICHLPLQRLSFPGSSVGEESIYNAGNLSSVPGLGRSPGEGTGYPPQYSWASLVAQLVKNLPAMRET